MNHEPLNTTVLHGRRSTARWHRLSVGDLFERLRWSTPDKDAIVAMEGAWTRPERARLSYRDADALANRFAQGLLAQGLQRGDRVLLICENSVEAYVAKIGIAKAGGVCAPLNPNLAPDTKSHVIARLEPRLAVVDLELLAANQAVLQQHGLGGVFIPIDAQGPLPLPDPMPGWVDYDSFVADRPDAEPEVEIAGDDVWQIIFTSGTTSWPKGAMITHTGAYLAGYGHALTHSRGVRCEADLRLCCTFPLIYHAADMSDSFPAFLCGGTLVIARKPSGAQMAEAVTREKVTALWAGSPQFLAELVDVVRAQAPRYDLRSVVQISWAWKAMSPAIVEALTALCGPGLQLAGRIGQTEAIACTRFWPERWRDKFEREAPQRNFVGVASPLLSAAVIDGNGRLMDPVRDRGTPGELVYRSPANTAGYFGNEEATREATRSGWFHSGDCCEYDENHLLVMVDRFKDLVKSGGENVSSVRVESALSEHPAVAEAAVVGLPHARWGEAVTAFVILKPSASADPVELAQHCRARLAGFESPKRVLVVDEFPRTVGRKVLKFKIREAYADLYADAA